MTQRISKHGTRYTEGSHSTPEPGFPNVCSVCGARILTSKQSYEHHTDDVTGEKRARHLPVGDCEAAA